MKKTETKDKRITALLFFITVAFFSVSGLVKTAWHYLGHENDSSEFIPGEQSRVDHLLSENFFLNRELITLNGGIHRVLGQCEMNTVIKQSDGWLAGHIAAADPAVLSANAAKLKETQSWLDEKGIYCLYVGAPYTVDKASPLLPAGEKVTVNDDLDTLYAYFDEEKINYIDMREVYDKLPTEYHEHFYRTDHHWNAEGAFECFREILPLFEEGLDTEFDDALTDISSYDIITYPGAHLGSSGQRTGALFAGIDDFDVMLPSFPTQLRRGEESGSFEEIILDMSAINGNDLNSRYTYDTTFANSRRHIYNDLAGNELKLLVIGDSYATALNPFLALAFSEIKTYEKLPDDGEIKKYDPDAVIFVYYPWSAFDAGHFGPEE